MESFNNTTNYKEKYMKYKLKYNELKNQQGGACVQTDGPDRMRVMIEGNFDNNSKKYKIVLHALKHIDTLGLPCGSEAFELVKHYVLRALHTGKLSDGQNIIPFLNSYQGRTDFNIIGNRTEGTYSIRVSWDYNQKSITVYSICRSDQFGNCRY